MGGAFTLALTLAPGAVASTPTVGKGRAEPVTETVRIASYNAGAMVSTHGTVADVKALIDEGADVIALQETSSWAKRVKIRDKYVDCETCVYKAWIPVPAVPGGQPILYRSDKFELLGYGALQVTQDTYVGPRGAGPSTIRAKYITWVRLRSLATKRQAYVLNNHAVPTVQRGDGTPNTRLAKRLAIYGKHMAGLTAFINEIKSTTGGAVFVVGDLNVNYRTDRAIAPEIFPYHTLSELDLEATYEPLGMPEHGTHVLPNGFDKRLIDYGYFLHRRFVSPTAQAIPQGLHSDHRPLVVDYRLSSRGCFHQGVNECDNPV